MATTRLNLGEKLKALRTRAGSRAAPQSKPQPEAVQPLGVALSGRRAWAYGLDWQLCPDRKAQRQAMKQARAKGFTHHVVYPSVDLLGFGALADRSVKKPVVVALHLAESASTGGLEFFLFEFSDGEFGVTGLNDSTPIPHFDHLGSQAEALEKLAQFQSLYPGQPIRYVSNTELIDTAEKTTLSDVLVMPEPPSELKALPNYRLQRLVLVVVLPLLLAIGGALGWVQWQEQQREQERLAREQDPNYIYENAVTSAMQQTGLAAQVQLDLWRTWVLSVPVAREGWRLEKISCQGPSCKAVWKRDFGSYRDFYLDSGQKADATSESQTADNPAAANIETVHNLSATSDAASGLKREELPLLRPTLQDIGSLLQDLSLVPSASVKLKAPDLYPATGASKDQIHKPVLRGEWAIEHELWSLSDLTLPQAHWALSNLTIVFDEKAKTWNYTLTGHYYAKGKNF